MLHFVGWSIVAGLAAIWSLACWAFNTIGVWALSNADQLSGLASGLGQWPIPSWLSPWVPEALLHTLTPLIAETATWAAQFLQAIPGLSGGFSIVVGVIWALGMGALVLLGVVASGGIVWWRRRALRNDSGGSAASSGR